MGNTFFRCYCKIPTCELKDFNFVHNDSLFSVHTKLHNLDKYGFSASHLETKCKHCNFRIQWYDCDSHCTARKHMFTHMQKDIGLALARCRQFSDCPISLLDEYLCKRLVQIVYD
jgi:hypothetical protein